MFPQIHLLGFQISTYFLIISLAVTKGSFWFIERAESRHLSRVRAIDLSLVILISGFLGARLLHIFFEDQSYYLAHPWAALQIWNGGFVFLGGLLAALIGAVVFCQMTKEPFWFWADVATLPISFTYAVGRLACFANGCCFGKTCELPWAIYLHGGFRHPTQVYASLWEVLVLMGLWKFERRFKLAGAMFNTWLLLHSVGRLVMEHFRDDPRGPQVMGLSLGTTMSLGLLAFSALQLYASRNIHHEG